ncbi:MAG: ATP-binding protein [Desulfurivibrionaceae bacterium]|nr:ATP-binding protein [Desulfurivibrionaceae bacterium]
MIDTFANTPPRDSTTSRIAFSWLLKLRWGAVICQLLIILAVGLVFDIDIPVPILLAVIFFQICSNFYFHHLKNKQAAIRPLVFGLIMVWDIVQLTVLIYFSGGPMNPFTFIYLVHVALGAILMGQRWAWGLNLLAIVCYAMLFLLPPAPDFNPGLVAASAVSPCLDKSSMGLHLQGMWAAFTLTALFIVFFVSRIGRAMGGHQQTLASLEKERQRSEKMASLATLAAGAAHEFSTPLATIAIAAGEMAHQLDEQGGAPELRDDAALIKKEVKKCRDILRQLAADAGEHLGESFVAVTPADFLDKVVAEFKNETGREIPFELDTEIGPILIPLHSWLRAIKGLLKNGLDACPNGKIHGRLFSDREYLAVSIADEGPGMTPEETARAAEPFFTTKAPGKGLGLGLFLARTLAERFGGDLLIESTPGRGTKVTFRVKLARITP